MMCYEESLIFLSQRGAFYYSKSKEDASIMMSGKLYIQTNEEILKFLTIDWT